MIECRIRRKWKSFGIEAFANWGFAGTDGTLSAGFGRRLAVTCTW